MDDNSKIEYFNMALARIGSQLEITGDDDESNEYKMCERLYKQALREVYTIYPWRSCRKTTKLNRFSHCEHIRFKKAYQLPADFLVLAEVAPTRIEYEVINKVLYSNDDDIRIAYTAMVDVSNLTPALYNLAVLKLAMMIIPSLAKGSFNIKDNMLQEFWQIELNNAKSIEIRENLSRPRRAWWIECD